MLLGAALDFTAGRAGAAGGCFAQAPAKAASARARRTSAVARMPGHSTTEPSSFAPPCLTSTMTGTRQDSGGSVLTSLRELASLEAERVRDAREREARRAEEEAARQREEERIAREAALAHTRALEEAEQRRANRDREEAARAEAIRVAAVEAARLEVARRSHADEAERAHRHALEIEARRAEVRPKHRGAMAVLAAGAGASAPPAGGGFVGA